MLSSLRSSKTFKASLISRSAYEAERTDVMRFWRALDLGADGVGGLRGDDAAVFKDGEAPRSEKYEVAIIGEGAGEMGPLAAMGQFANVDSASGMGCVVPATCGYTRQKCVYDTLALARTILELGH